MSLFNKYSNADAVTIKLISSLNIPITSKTLIDELAIHPDYPSLLSISEVLNELNIQNSAYEVNLDGLNNAPCPFIAHTTLNNRDFVLVEKTSPTSVWVSNETWTRHELPKEEFLKAFTGIILTVESIEQSGEIDYTKNKRIETVEHLRYPAMISGLILIIFLGLLTHISYFSSWQSAILVLFKTIGLAVSVLLLIQGIDRNNPIVQILCGTSEKTNCNSILSSRAAKVFDWLSWSEIGFFYFAGTWLALLFNQDSNNVIGTLAILNIISLPYTVYSIYYQWRIAKQWCVLCCIVQGLLWIEFIPLFSILNTQNLIPDLHGGINLFICFVSPVLFWMFIKPFILSTWQNKRLKYQLRKFKYNTDLFNNMLNSEVKYNLLSEDDSIIIGNRDAEHIVTVVSSPYCEPCAKVHGALDKWLSNRENIKLQVVFATINNENDLSTKAASHFLSLQLNQDDRSLKKAMSDWYEQKSKSYESWAKEYPLTNRTSVNQTLEKQKNWCLTTEITGTPTLFINGRKLPTAYTIEDIKYFI